VLAGLPRLLREGRGGNADRGRLTPALLILTGGAAVTFAAYLAFKLRCDRIGCRHRSGRGFAELDDWWRARSSWQWGAQLLLASVALSVAAAAFWLSVGERRGTRPAVWAARALYAAWVVLVFVLPVAYGVG
jgi:hypothetical protein